MTPATAPVAGSTIGSRRAPDRPPVAPSPEDVLRRFVAARAETEAVRPAVLPAIRDLAVRRYGSVSAFADELAVRAGLHPVTARNGLYSVRAGGKRLIDVALEMLGFVAPAA